MRVVISEWAVRALTQSDLYYYYYYYYYDYYYYYYYYYDYTVTTKSELQTDKPTD